MMIFQCSVFYSRNKFVGLRHFDTGQIVLTNIAYTIGRGSNDGEMLMYFLEKSHHDTDSMKGMGESNVLSAGCAYNHLCLELGDHIHCTIIITVCIASGRDNIVRIICVYLNPSTSKVCTNITFQTLTDIWLENIALGLSLKQTTSNFPKSFLMGDHRIIAEAGNLMIGHFPMFCFINNTAKSRFHPSTHIKFGPRKSQDKINLF